MKLFLFFLATCILSASILFGLPYVGVTMATILIIAMIVSGIGSFFFRPKGLKKIEKEVGKFAHNAGEEISSSLKELNYEIQKERNKELKTENDELREKIRLLEQKSNK